MRRTLVASKGFHAPRSSGGSAQPPPPTAPASSASPLPPPPAAAAAAAQASLSTAAPASSTKAASPSKAVAPSTATKRRASTKTASSPSHNASSISSSASARGGGTVRDMLAGRGALSGHFSANHLRRGQRREDLHDGSTAPPPLNSANSLAAAAVASAACVHGENVPTSLTPAGETESRKRSRSSSVDPAFALCAGDAPLYLLPPSHPAPSAIGETPEDYPEHLSARPSRRLSSCVPRNVFYPPPAELTVAVNGTPASAFQGGEWAHAVSGPQEPSLQPNHREPLPCHVHTPDRHDTEVSAIASMPGSSSSGGKKEEATPSTASSTTQSGTRFLSALEHQQLCSAPALAMAVMATPPYTTTSQLPPTPTPTPTPPTLLLPPHKALTFSQASSNEDQPLLQNSPNATPPSSTTTTTTTTTIAAAGPLGNVPQPHGVHSALHLTAAAAAGEDEEHVESEEALQREMAEDLRLSMDVAFTPSGSGNGAPPVLSQSSLLHEEEEREGGLVGRGSPRTSGMLERLEEVEGRVMFTPVGSGLQTVAGEAGMTDGGSAAAQKVAGQRSIPLVGDASANTLGEGASTIATDSCLPFSAPSWPLHEAPPPPLPAPFVNDTCSRQPPSTMATVAAAAAASVSATGSTGSRHRTVFTFASLKAAAGEEETASSSLPSALTAPPPPPPGAAESPQPALPPPSFSSCCVAEEDAEGERSILLPPAFVTSQQQRLGEEVQQAPPHTAVVEVTATRSKAEEVKASMRAGWGVTAVVGGNDSASGPSSANHPSRTPAGENRNTAPTSPKNAAGGTTPPVMSPQLPVLRASETVSPRCLFPPPVLLPTTNAAATAPNAAAASIARRRRTCFTLYSSGAAPPDPSPTLSAGGEDTYPSNSNSLSLPPPTAENPATAAAASAAGQVTETHSAVKEASTIALAPAEEQPFRDAVCGAATAAVVVWPEEAAPIRTAAVAVVDAPAAPEKGCGVEATTAPATAAPPTPPLPTSPQPREPSFHTAAAEVKELPVVPLPTSTPLAAMEYAAEMPQQQSHRTSLPLQTTTGSFYDLPPSMREFYEKHRGVRQLYAWQHDLLTQPEVRAGRNFIYSLPTSGGKTLVAELSLLRCVVNRRKSGIFVLPFVSLAEEKTLALQPLTAAFDFAVDGHYGSSGRFPLCEAPAIYVCTIEKANSLLNYMLEEGRTGEIGAVVVDELHMVGESRRGATLELFLSKLLLIDRERQEQRAAAAAAAVIASSQQQQQQKSSGQRHPMNAAEEDEEGWAEEEGVGYFPEDEEGRAAASVQPPLHSAHVFVDPGPLQIIGMSATIPNLSTLAEWLHAACFERDFRPVPLHAYSVVGGLVLRDGQANERNLSGASVAQHLLELATEMPEASVLVFCASRQQCVDTARGIVHYLKAQAIAGQQLPAVPSSGTTTSTPTTAAAAAPGFSVFGVGFTGVGKPSSVAAVPAQMSVAIRSLLADLEALAHHEASQLSEIVPHGVAFHHGGLLAEERELIEDAFRRKHVRILCSTSTLAAGVNLPARRVIIKTPYVGRDFLTKSRYLQMCGRAGRAGLDPYGESYLLLTRRDQSRGSALMKAAVEPCRSQILEDDQTLTRSLLECIGVGLVTDTASARAWSASLLSCHAVGPVDAVWRQHLLPAAPPPPVTIEAAPLSSSADTTAVLVPPSSTGATIATAESENSRSVPQPPPLPAAVPPAIPLSALAAMTGASLATLDRCGLVVTSTQSPASSPSAAAAAAGAADDEEAEQGWESLPLQVRVTPFGSSSVRSCFSVEEALLLREELDELRHTGLILSDDLHLCYFLTPLREVGECDWAMLRLMMSRMSDSRQRIASLLGVDAYFIDQQAMGLGGPLQVTEEGRRRLFTAKRFYVALMLADVLAEVPMPTVEQRYNVNRGQLQNLMRSASMFSSSITSFCHAMEWYSLEAVLSSFVKRLGFGVKPDLLPLMEVRGMQPPRARALWNAGFKKLSAIAAADADDMVAKVKALNPTDSKSAKFFTKRSALMVIREAHLTLQSQIKEKKGELQELTVRRGAAQ